MVKKMKSSTGPDAAGSVSKGAAGLIDSHMASAVKDSAQQIWLAGMGAFSKAQEGGTKVFDALIKEGLNLQKKTQGIAEEKISEVTGKMTAMAGTVQAKAGQNWDKLEAIFEARTAKAMNKLGVPTAKDVQALTQRVDELAAAVAALSKSTARKAAAPKAAATAAAKAPRARKSAAKPGAAPFAPAKRARRKSAAA